MQHSTLSNPRVREWSERPADAAPASDGLLLLVTDQPDRSAALAEAIEQVAPCRVLPVEDRCEAIPGTCLGIVADIDVLSPAALRSLRASLAMAGSPAPPFVCLPRCMGERSLAEARALGAALCLPTETAPDTVVQAVLALASPGRSLNRAKVDRGVHRAGATLTGLLDSARASGIVDAAAVEEGLAPILMAVGSGGLDLWLDTVRSYDDGTYQHCLLVAGLAAQFSIDLGFGATDRQRFVRAALVHDVGKARIPLAILNKPGRLDPEEVAIMRTHAAVGHDILVRTGEFDATTLAVVRHHHEMLDGSGYPDGLSGGQIEDVVRLATICDIYAALVERRPYKAPMTSAVAIAVLESMEGKLDPTLVKAFARTVGRR